MYGGCNDYYGLFILPQWDCMELTVRALAHMLPFAIGAATCCSVTSRETETGFFKCWGHEFKSHSGTHQASEPPTERCNIFWGFKIRNNQFLMKVFCTFGFWSETVKCGALLRIPGGFSSKSFLGFWFVPLGFALFRISENAFKTGRKKNPGGMYSELAGTGTMNVPRPMIGQGGAHG